MPRPTRFFRIRRPLLIGFGFATATTFVALVDPNHGHYPLCPTKYLTGLDCPFCGGLRAVHSLTHGHVTAALHHNALVALALPFVAFGWVLWLRREWRGEPAPLRDRREVAREELALLAIAILFMLIRNLPVGAALASGSVH
ncbi:MAG: DUF2752 domain-containing protein [Actinomycetes bacterium]